LKKRGEKRKKTEVGGRKKKKTTQRMRTVGVRGVHNQERSFRSGRGLEKGRCILDLEREDKCPRSSRRWKEGKGWGNRTKRNLVSGKKKDANQEEDGLMQEVLKEGGGTGHIADFPHTRKGKGAWEGRGPCPLQTD